jgi:hypothetical protein
MNIVRYLSIFLCVSALSCCAYAQSSEILVGTSAADNSDFPFSVSRSARAAQDTYDSLLDVFFFTLFDMESPIREDGLTLMKRTGFIGSRYTLEVNLQPESRNGSDLLDPESWGGLFSTVRFCLETPLN